MIATMITQTDYFTRETGLWMADDRAQYSDDESRWSAVVGRERAADGVFFYGVATTGVYCRPACASREPRRENVRFFATPDDAEAAGYRPCKRCRPREAAADLAARQAVLDACRLIDALPTPPSLEALAAAANLSPSHFHRVFKRTLGLTPRQYAHERRMAAVRDGLAAEAPVTDTVYSAGFGASSRFYEVAGAELGMRPGDYRRGGQGERIRYATAPSYLGRVLVAATDRGVCRISFGDADADLLADLRKRFPAAELSGDDPGFAADVARVLALLEHPQGSLDLPLDIQGTAFQRRVWAALRAIPPGTTASYGEVAAAIGEPMAARAVAQACGANELAVAVPCHRVVAANGGLGGYRWGVERKRALLGREAADFFSAGAGI